MIFDGNTRLSLLAYDWRPWSHFLTSDSIDARGWGESSDDQIASLYEYIASDMTVIRDDDHTKNVDSLSNNSIWCILDTDFSIMLFIYVQNAVVYEVKQASEDKRKRHCI